MGEALETLFGKGMQGWQGTHEGARWAASDAGFTFLRGLLEVHALHARALRHG
jgi:hypothetical protein